MRAFCKAAHGYISAGLGLLRAFMGPLIRQNAPGVVIYTPLLSLKNCSDYLRPNLKDSA